jgi:ankyrin repeat protein
MKRFIRHEHSNWTRDSLAMIAAASQAVKCRPLGRTPSPLVVAMIWMLSACTLSQVDRDLLTAARLGDDTRVDAALSAGANTNVKRRDGRTPLMLAAESGDVATVAALLTYGADPNVRAVYGETALMLATPNVVQLLVESGAEVNARFGSGKTILMSTTDAEKARALLAAGAEVDARLDGEGDSGPTALIHATSNRFPSIELVRVLLEGGADVNVADSNGQTALIRASEVAADEEVMVLLLEAGADVNVADREGWTPLHFAAADRRAGKVSTLLAADADVNARAENGATPLLVAREHHHDRIAKMLTKAGAEDSSVTGAVEAKPGASNRSWRDTAGRLHGTVPPVMGPGSAIRSPPPNGLVIQLGDQKTDGRVMKIRGKVKNLNAESVHGIRYVVTFYDPTGSRVLDSVQREVDTTIESEGGILLRLDVESMYLSGGVRFTVNAFPIKVGDRELSPPDGWNL